MPWVCRSLVDRRASEPNSIVVSNAATDMTIEEFSQRAASVAVRLSSDSAEKFVVMYVDRTPDAAAAMIGVRWAGRCVVPVSLEDPPARVLEIAQRVGSRCIVDATGHGPCHVGDVAVTSLRECRTDWMDPVEMAGVDPAIIVFTSGSTGRPKGVLRTSWQDDYSVASILQGDTHPWRRAIHSPLQWLGGFASLRRAMIIGSIHLIDAVQMTPIEIVREWERARIDRVSLTPSLLETITRSTPQHVRCEGVQSVYLVGEGVRWATIADSRRIVARDAEFTCSYGGSEALGNLFKYSIGPDQKIGEGMVPLGLPTGDHIRLERCDVGDDAVREVVVYKWVSNGYWDDADLQSSRFGRTTTGEPFWRSGDLVTVGTDGLVRFAGRFDDMVKISGKLVEPAETMRILDSCPGVQRSVVLPRRLANGRSQLVAHIEVSDATTSERVRRHLDKNLPPHLIPAVMMRHESLPLTERGKVDRTQLNRSPLVAWRSKPPTPPRSPFETRVLTTIQSFLNLESMGMDDDLWLYGLDSLGAVELCEILARLGHVELTAADFLGASTPRQIVTILRSTGARQRMYPPVLHVGENRRPYVLVPAAGGSAAGYRQFAEEIGADQPVIVYEQWGLTTRGRWDRDVAAAARRFVGDLCTRMPTGPYVLIGHSFGGIVAHEMGRVLRERGEDVHLILLDTGRAGADRRDRRWEILARHDDSWLAAMARRVYWRLFPYVDVLAYRHRADRRHHLFYRRGIRSARRHRAGVFGGPMLVVEVPGSRASSSWSGEPGLESALVPGGHNSMIWPPNVRSVAEVIHEFLEKAQRVSGSDDHEMSMVQ